MHPRLPVPGTSNAITRTGRSRTNIMIMLCRSIFQLSTPPLNSMTGACSGRPGRARM